MSKVKKKIIIIRYSNIIAKICLLLYKKGYVIDYIIIKNNYLIIQLKYYKNKSVFYGIKRILIPG